jgi:hypothetical protein
VAAGLVLDVITARTSHLGRAYPEPARLDVVPGLQATVHLDVRLTRRWHLFAAAGLEASFVRGAYTVSRGATTVTLLRPWPVTPLLSAGLAVTLW